MTVQLSSLWSELKAVLVLSPRRSLLYGGRAALALDRVSEVKSINEAPPSPEELAARAKLEKERSEAEEEAQEAAAFRAAGRDAISAAAEEAEAALALREAEQAAEELEASLRKTVYDAAAEAMAAEAERVPSEIWLGEAEEGGKPMSPTGDDRNRCPRRVICPLGQCICPRRAFAPLGRCICPPEGHF